MKLAPHQEVKAVKVKTGLGMPPPWFSMCLGLGETSVHEQAKCFTLSFDIFKSVFIVIFVGEVAVFAALRGCGCQM